MTDSDSDSDESTEDEQTFDRTDEGYYRITEPIGGFDPDEVLLTFGTTQYRFHGFVGTETESSVFPRVLLYEDVDIFAVPSESDSSNDGPYELVE